MAYYIKPYIGVSHRCPYIQIFIEMYNHIRHTDLFPTFETDVLISIKVVLFKGVYSYMGNIQSCLVWLQAFISNIQEDH